MYLLDTNVVSELRRARPHGAVLAWIRGIPDADLHISVMTLGEIQAGIEMTRQTDAVKAAEIEVWLEQLAATFNVLVLDAPILRRWARLMHRRQTHNIEDAMIAATALERSLIVVTRNTRDFEGFGAELVDPFEAR